MKKNNNKEDDFKEKFVIPLDFWSVDQYQAHWVQGIERITKGAFKSCLITALYDPQIAHPIFWWIIYREGQKCIFQNQMLIILSEDAFSSLWSQSLAMTFEEELAESDTV